MMMRDRSFPVGLRVFAAACALFVLAWFPPLAGAQTTPTTEEDVQAAKAKLDAGLDELKAMNRELDQVQGRLHEAAFEVDRQEGILEKITADLLETRDRIDRARARLDQVQARLNERAAEAFIEGPGSNLEFLLGSSSLADLSDRLEFVDAMAEADANLAQEVQNLRNELLVDEQELEVLQGDRERELDKAEQQEAAVLADLDLAQELASAIEAKAATFRAELKQTEEDKAAYDRQVKRQERLAAQTHSGPQVPLPPGFENIIRVCPVDPPRGFGDGFGAPRYVGGYHPHRGVDIVAPEGTPVRAPFDGVARDATNTFGGTSVIVEGAYGYVYNAHLGSITQLGAVSAGDVIGTLSSTGLAGGTTPHLHFEFHPNVIPSGWPVSYYGYSVIDSAINPYPLLLAACG